MEFQVNCYILIWFSKKTYFEQFLKYTIFLRYINVVSVKIQRKTFPVFTKVILFMKVDTAGRLLSTVFLDKTVYLDKTVFLCIYVIFAFAIS